MHSDIIPVAHLMVGEDEFCDCAKTLWKFFLDQTIVSFGNFFEITCGNFVGFTFLHMGLTFHKFLKTYQNGYLIWGF
jgi:hypothetical protein